MTVTRLIPAALASAGAAVLMVWLSGAPAAKVEQRLPGADRRQVAAPPVATAWAPSPDRASKPRGTLVVADGAPADLPGAWPRFRGEDFDNVSKEDIALVSGWGDGGPPVLWTIAVGEGYAGVAVRAGRVYLLDYDQENRADALRCLSLADGKEIWRYSYAVEVKRNHGMSRTVPAVSGEYVVALGPKCHVSCLDATTGQPQWELDLARDFGTEVPRWYAGQCPLIDNGRVILAVGGHDALMMAVDCATGQVLWKTPNPHGWQMTHSSIMPMELGGRRMYVYCAGGVSRGAGGVVGVSAEDGKILWSTDAWHVNINVPSPVIVGDGRVLLSGGYGAGSMMLQLTDEAGRIDLEQVFRVGPKVFGAEQHTPIIYDGYIYGMRTDGQLVCLDLTGNVVWASGAARFGKGRGPYLIADGRIFVMDGAGTLTLVEATPEGYRQLAQATIFPDGHDAWGPMAIAGGRLILRDLTRVTCLDVRAPQAAR